MDSQCGYERYESTWEVLEKNRFQIIILGKIEDARLILID